MSVQNYAYMRHLWQHQRALQEAGPETIEHIEQIPTSSSAGRPSSDHTSLRLHRSHSGSGSQVERRPSRLARIFIPARLRRAKSFENDDPPFLPPAVTRPGTSTATTASTTSSSTADPAKHIFRLYSAHLTNPFSPGFELNPLLLNITHPLLSTHRPKRRNRRVLDLGGIEGSMPLDQPQEQCLRLLIQILQTGLYTQTIAGLPHVAVCQLTQPQLSTNFPPYLPFKSKSFDVVTTRTLYKFLANPNRPATSDPTSWVREIYRVLDKGGSLEFLFIDSDLTNVGPLTREMAPCLYDDHRLCRCSQDHDACICSPTTPTPEAMTGAQFLDLLARERFVIEKSTTLMFPFTLISSMFTPDGQQLKVYQQNDRLDVTPLLASLMKTIDEECRVHQTAWRCIIGSAQKV
ncbi:hypothetical protein BJX64DRAFT_291690 [Aspergillus heterothallicus]